MEDNRSMRVFLSFHVPETIGRELLGELSDLPIILYPAENLHITFKFIGDVSPRELETLKAITSVVTEYCEPFQFIPRDFSIENDRLRLYMKADSSLFAAQSAFSNELEKIPLGKKDQKQYAPHITLGRPLQGFDLSSIQIDLQKYAFQANELGLYQSEQGVNQNGVYTLLHTFALGKVAHDP